jgi:uncharacterized protein YggE
VTLGKIVTVTANASPIMPRQYVRMRRGGRRDVDEPHRSEAGDVTVTANLQVTYAIE